MIIAKTSGTSFELVPVGNHVARCYAMVEIGTVTDEYMGAPKSLHKVRVSWELPHKKKIFNPEKGEQPFSIHKEYTLSMHEKSNLRQDLESWRGKAFTEEEAKAFDVTKLLGKECMINIIHNVSRTGNAYAQIASITPVPEGMVCPPQINPTFVLSYSEWEQKKFDLLPEWIRKKMEDTPQYKSLFSGGSDVKADITSDDDIPF